MQDNENSRKVVFLDREKAFDQLLEMGGLLAFEDQVNEVLAAADWDAVDEIVRDMDDTWLQELMNKEKRKTRRKKTGRTILRVANVAACFAGILISVFAILFFTVEPVRAQVIRFVVEHYPEYSYYSPLFHEETNPLESLYKPSYIPDGFNILYDTTYSGIERLMAWQNGERMITFRQAAVDDNSFLDTEVAEISSITIMGEEAALILKELRIEVYFVKGNTSITLIVDDSLEEAIRIAESIQEEKP